MEYIDWAVSENFGVMDINVPAYVTQEEVRVLDSEHLCYTFLPCSLTYNTGH
jgi:hypothetical protein